MGDSYYAAINSLGWREITKWYLLLNGIHFNHIEDGHCLSSEPTPRDAYQKARWHGQRWSKRLSYMTMDLPAIILN